MASAAWPSDALAGLGKSIAEVQKETPQKDVSLAQRMPITLRMPLRGLQSTVCSRDDPSSCCAVLYAGAPGDQCGPVPVWDLSEWECPNCDRQALCGLVTYNWVPNFDFSHSDVSHGPQCPPPTQRPDSSVIIAASSAVATGRRKHKAPGGVVR